MTGNGASSTAEPLVDLHGLAAGILWRRRLWVSVTVLGVLAGALATLLSPPVPTAVTRVLIAREGDTGGTGTSLMATDVALFNTKATAAAALQRLNLEARPEEFLESFTGESLTANVLLITAHGPSDAAAVRRARVLADTFIAAHVGRARQAAEAQARALRERRAELESEYTEVNNQIATASGSQVDVLSQRRASLATQIVNLGQQAQEALMGLPRVEAGTQIVDPPRAVSDSLVKTGVTNVAVGLVFGLAAGLSLAAVLCVVRDRPVLRRDIAAHLGVSVIVQLPAVNRRGLGKRGRRTREHLRAAGTLAGVVRGTPGSVSLLEVGCPRTAAALALAIADELADGRPVTVVDHLDGGHLDKARGRAGHQVEVVDVAAPRRPAPSSVGGHELRLGAGSVGPGSSWVDLDRLGSQTLLVVRAGHATTLWLHTVARRLAHAGISAIGVVLVAPYPGDGSDGTLWDGLHSVLPTYRPTVATMATPHSPGSGPAPYRNGSAPAEPDTATEGMRLR